MLSRERWHCAHFYLTDRAEQSSTLAVNGAHSTLDSGCRSALGQRRVASRMNSPMIARSAELSRSISIGVKAGFNGNS